MVDKDKPTINYNLTDLDNEETPEPYVVMTRQNKRVTFPDIYDLPAEEGEKFLMDLENEPDSKVLAKWLSHDDNDALKAHGLTLRQRAALVQRVFAYYEGTAGNSGEDVASEN